MDPSVSVREIIALKISDGQYSYRTLGEKLGVSHAYLNNVVKGRQRPPRATEFYLNLGQAFEIEAATISEYRSAVLRGRLEPDSDLLDSAWEKLANDLGGDYQVRIGSGAGTSGLRIFLDKYSVELDGSPLSLSYKEFELLRVMASEVDRVFTRDILLETVWGYGYFGGTRTVDVHITRLRAKLGSQAMLIQTVHQVGYRFVGPVEII